MPIYLRAPAHNPNGPDGQGWNRISLGSLASDECALRPLDYSHLRESHADTRRARYGGYGPCIADGNCETCPVFQAAPRTMAALSDRVLVRIGHDGSPYLMNRPGDGWASVARRWSWQDLARLEGWTVGRAYRDSHGEGFWLEREPATEAPFVPPAHYRRDDGVECCVHTVPVGPGSCQECRDLDDHAPATDARQ